MLCNCGFDVANRAHGTCGVGFGATMKRHEETPLRLYAVDLLNEQVWKYKFRSIAESYGFDREETNKYMVLFSQYVLDFIQIAHIIRENEFFLSYAPSSNLIFEGAQGVLLDREFGFFPHVTRSHTTARNAVELIEKYDLEGNITCIGVSRCYHTRHGAGPFTEFEDQRM